MSKQVTAIIPLTPRETDVAYMVAKDYSNVQIGLLLKIRPLTVNTNIRNAMRKLNLRTRVGLAVWYVRAVT